MANLYIYNYHTSNNAGYVLESITMRDDWKNYKEGKSFTISGDNHSIMVEIAPNSARYAWRIEKIILKDGWEIKDDKITILRESTGEAIWSGDWKELNHYGANENWIIDFTPIKISVKIPVTGITLSKTELSIEVGKSATLTPMISPLNATNQAVTWKSSDSTIATVVNGVITGQKSGSAVISVTTEDGGYTASCKVTVSAGLITPKLQIYRDHSLSSSIEVQSVTMIGSICGKLLFEKQVDNGILFSCSTKVDPTQYSQKQEWQVNIFWNDGFTMDLLKPGKLYYGGAGDFIQLMDVLPNQILFKDALDANTLYTIDFSPTKANQTINPGDLYVIVNGNKRRLFVKTSGGFKQLRVGN